MKIFVFVFIFIILITNVFAADFFIQSVQKLTDEPYKGDFVNFKGIIKADSSNICKIKCQYSVTSNSGYVSDNGNYPATELGAGDIQEFPFSIIAEGNGSISRDLVVTCERVVNYINCWPGSATNTKPISFNFFYAGDSICTHTKEKCKTYQGFFGTSDCNCFIGQECRPDGNRSDLDEKGCQSYCGDGIYQNDYEDCSCNLDFNCPSNKKCKYDDERIKDNDGCTTYCGNSICEFEYENCSTCSIDCNKCDLMPCSRNSDCYGKFCVWGVCYSDIYRVNDSHCDNEFGENCANSPIDCSCSANQRCNSGGFCDSYCGNSICEEKEKGICNYDCKWCGDSICQDTESCSTCPDDCGNCRIISGVSETVVKNHTQKKDYGSSIVNTNDNEEDENSETQISIIDSKNYNKTSRLKTKYELNKDFIRENYPQIIMIFFIMVVIVILILYIIINKRIEKNGHKK